MLSYSIVDSLSLATEFASSMETAMVASSTNPAIRSLIEQGLTLSSRQIGDGWYVEVRRDTRGKGYRLGLLKELGRA